MPLIHALNECALLGRELAQVSYRDGLLQPGRTGILPPSVAVIATVRLPHLVIVADLPQPLTQGGVVNGQAVDPVTYLLTHLAVHFPPCWRRET